MLSFKKVSCAGALSAALLSGISPAADKITMEGGAVVEGQVIRDVEGDPLVVINTGSKLLCVNRSEVSSVKLDEEGRADFARRQEAIKGGSAVTHFELYKWAKARRLYDCADQELSATIKADPTHEGARKVIAELNAAAQANRPTLPVSGSGPVETVVDGQLVIGPRAVPKPVRERKAQEAKVLELCQKIYASASPEDDNRKAATAELSRDVGSSGRIMTALLDPQLVPQEEERSAVLSGIEAVKPSGPDLSKRLAYTAMIDPAETVRQKTVSLIKARNDEWAIMTMVNAFVDAYGENGQVKDAGAAAAGGAALRALNDKRVLGAIHYYATLEVRTAVSELTNLVTRQIDTFTVNNGAQATVLTLLSFPIQFPEVKITSVKTTVCAPCTALTALTGMNFGNDLEAWAKWIRKQP